MKTLKKLVVMMGLPGSGKTTFCNENFSKYSSSTEIIHIDNMSETRIKSSITNILSRTKTLVIDGLFLVPEDVYELVNFVKTIMTIENLEIHFWFPDREICKINDRGRRSQNSYITIDNAIIIQPTIEELQEHLGITSFVYKHYVVKRPDWEIFMLDNGYYDESGYLQGDTWSLGGYYGTSNGTSSISAEPQKEFIEFDELLEELCPQITFLQYKHLVRKCCDISIYEERDYYCGTETKARHICNLKKLYYELTEMGIIKEEE